MRVLSLRTLNRTLLERQFLLERTPLPVIDVVRHLVAMQAQEPNWPYVGLWTRVKGFAHGELTGLFQDRGVVRGTMVRRTQHLAAAEDFGWLRPSVQPVVRAAVNQSYFAPHLEGLDLDELASAGRELIRSGGLTRSELGRLLEERFPGRPGARLALVVESLESVVYPPPNGVWGAWGNRTSTPLALADEWTGVPMAARADLRTLVLRYLASFGPAGVMDVQAWSGLTRLREVVESLPLRTFRTVDGKVLYDVPDAPIADSGAPAPVRFLPAFDNAALGHKDRTRLISDADRRRIAPVAALGVPLFLVDGFVRGSWSFKDGALRITPFRPLTGAEEDAVLEEARPLFGFVAGPEARAGAGAGAPEDIAFA
ncbi:winged helix DNA-binding domain-containing protein [Streptomyces sp. NPDC057552]|uniref:winged helix DNA-binding domain-containing protein n=1 Tax=Streptomyces sp. NPDC057552 TaxID=3350537 RepID=UPI0036CBB8BC